MKPFALLPTAALLLAPAATTAQQLYDVTNYVDVTNVDVALTRLSVLLPVPQSNHYQTIEGYTASQGSVVSCIDSDNRLLDAYMAGADCPKQGESLRVSHSYRALLYPTYVNTAQFETLYPYDTTSAIYRDNTGTSGTLIDPANATIAAVSERLRGEHPDPIGYARACYDYVGANFSYLNANTGIHPLQENLDNGGGDCGNLCAIFISLLRAGGIPSRPVVMVRPGGSFHVWSEFYLQNYGWIPVDMSAKVEMPDSSTDFFGWYPGDGVIMSTGFNTVCPILGGATTAAAALIQAYLWYYYCSSGTQISTSYGVDGALTENRAMTTFAYEKLGDGKLRVSWATQPDATGYRLRVIDANNGDAEAATQAIGAEATEMVVSGLPGARNYRLHLEALRQVDNVETYMSSPTQWLYLAEEEGTGLEATAQDASRLTMTADGRLEVIASRPGVLTVTSASGALLLRAKLEPGHSVYPLADGFAVAALTLDNGAREVKKLVIHGQR
jgi:hypothetical protein